MRVILQIKAKRDNLGGFVPENHGKDFILTFVQSNYDRHIWIMEIVAPEYEIEQSISELDGNDLIENIKVVYCDDE